MASKSNIEKALDKALDDKKKIDDFADLIDSIESIDDKRKFLWKEIFQNAMNDRQHAYMLFFDLYKSWGSTAIEHNTSGAVLVKYLERMSKANEQLLKLADIIRTSSEEAKLTPDEIFDKISNGD